jgi:8-oxo-dGTP pyrophosphatase MutT (NUDIX family)
METTRHFTATTYVVNEGATALHEHPSLDIRIPPGGHIARDELPHEAAMREVREETGLDPTLVVGDGVPSPAGRSLPQPAYQMLYDVDVVDGEPAHQHVDHVFFAWVSSRDIDPAGHDEMPADAWDWYTPEELRADGFDEDVVVIGTEAIETVAASIEE